MKSFIQNKLKENSTMQSKLETYFAVSCKPSRKLFIYDQTSGRSYFATAKPGAEMRFVKRCGDVELYYVPGREENARIRAWKPAENKNIRNVALLKSNLQKAVRRGLTRTAVNTAAALLEIDAIALLRRLPIIYVEDVQPLASFTTVVWLMMAASSKNDYRISTVDREIVLEAVLELTAAKSIVLDGPVDENIAEAMKYRIMYGGTTGDMELLRCSPPVCGGVAAADVAAASASCLLDECGEVEIIPEAVDFHPFPKMVDYVRRNSGVEDAKSLIWFAESGVNIRKQDTLDVSRNVMSTSEWEIVKPYVYSFRSEILA